MLSITFLILLGGSQFDVAGAGAAPLAAALNMRDSLKGKKVVLILSGGNLSLEQLRSILKP